LIVKVKFFTPNYNNVGEFAENLFVPNGNPMF